MLKIHMKQNINIQLTNVKKVGLNRFNDPKPFIKYSNDMKDVYKNIDEYNTDKERKI